MKRFYSFFAFLLLFSFVISSFHTVQADDRDLTVVPNIYQGSPAALTFLGPLGNSQRTYQFLINANQLTGLIGQNIDAITYRLPTSATSDWPASDVTFTNYDIYLAQSVAPADRRLTFDSNIVGVKTQVRAGSLTITAGSYTFGNNPNNFGTDIEFDTPYMYTGGHLLIELRHTGFTGTSRSTEAASTSSSGYGTDFSACWTGNYTGTSGSQGNFVTVRLNSSTAGICAYSWESQTSGTTNAFNTVKAVSDMIGWAGGANATVRKTTDGGVTWTDGNPNPGVINGTIYAIESFGADTAWCTTSPAAAFIYRTTNGGANWVQVHTQTGGFFNAIKFQNRTTGFIQGDPVGGRWSLWRTTDAGATWDSAGMYLQQAGSEAGWNNSVTLRGTTLWMGTNNTKVYKSTDFGSTWTSSPTTGSLNGYSMDFSSSSLGIVGGTAVVKTTDGGSTYSSAITLPGTGNILGIGGTGDIFWAGRGAAIYMSTDAGDTWASHFTPSGTVNAMDIVEDGDCATGWAVGATGSISRLSGLLVGVGNNNTELPETFRLEQNYPNPFNPSTTISFSMPKADNVELKVYDLLGREVATLISGFRVAGSYRMDFNASHLSSGVYIYRLQAGDFVESKRMTLIK